MILENGITHPENLAVGQTIAVIHPEQIHSVKEGDSLQAIADKYEISLMQLLQNNPYLSDREFIYPGEILNVSFSSKKANKIATSGYAYPYIDKRILRKTLPYLTYLTIFNTRVTMEGDLIEPDDKELIQLANEFGVAPMMFVSTFSEYGIGDRNTAYHIINNYEIQDKIINTVIGTLKQKGYYGVNIYLQYLNIENRTRVEEYIEKFSYHLRREGFRFVVTVTPKFHFDRTGILFDGIELSNIAKFVDTIVILNYEWGISYGAPGSVSPVNISREMLNHTLNMVPYDKVFLGLPNIGYDWPLPYIQGATKANAITNIGAIEIAYEKGQLIQFNELSQASYFFYYEGKDLHMIWFKDARSFNAVADLVIEYKINGISIWNIMYFDSLMWLVLNSKFEIFKVYNKK